MKKYMLGMMAGALLAMGGTAHAEKTRVGFAPEAYPPFWVADANGNWTGWEVEIIDAVCAEAKLDCERVPVAWEGIIPALLGGKIDMIMNSMRINDERRKVIDFSNKYYEVPTVVVAAKSATVDTTPESMDGKIIGVQVSTGQQAYAEKNFAANASEIRGYNTQDEVYQDLAAGRIDVAIDGVVAMNEFLKSASGTECCESKGVLKRDPSTLGEGYGVGLRKGDDALKAKINDAIAAIRKNGTYDAITNKYFDFDIYGGD
ncbi:transporter substrate-binding domain-containing protein (plasmid) [Shinella sp. H4-D48]|uniref:transporter substrate-binding domain-containing protein n=1 Tax=Shinella sp. H4-D48 TaxID=2925841 RepID=UPI001F53C816|nr:transporter substrate-binding domain-containing protein [Shinella sp. H4-D48]UNK40767.1 transporter substrate-binding domain-containing protein [Shinella sp. H4-D48]